MDFRARVATGYRGNPQVSTASATAHDTSTENATILAAVLSRKGSCRTMFKGLAGRYKADRHTISQEALSGVEWGGEGSVAQVEATMAECASASSTTLEGKQYK